MFKLGFLPYFDPR